MGTIYSDLNSDFPDKVSTMTRVQDVSAAMKPYVDQYYTYYNRGDFESANAVITAHPELQYMLINAKIFNDMRDEIVATQRTFRDDVESYIFNVVKNKGDWNASIKYVKYNIVYYTIGTTRIPYMANADDIPIGTPPTEITYWYPLAVKGEQGDTGLGLTPRGYWSNETQYHTHDLVAYNNALWSAIGDNINYIPTDNSTMWLKVMAFSSEYLTYDNETSGLVATDLQGAIDELNTKLNVANTEIDALDVRVDECFQSVSNGKQLVANAITDLGVATSATDTFATIASNIGKIETGIKTDDATATAMDIAAGKTAYVNDQKITGTTVVDPNLISNTNHIECDDAITVGAFSSDSVGRIYIRPSYSSTNPIYLNADRWYTITQSRLAEAIGLTSDMIVTGKTVLGIVGTGIGQGKWA